MNKKEICEEGRLKIEKIERYKEASYDYKINSFFWAALSVLETLLRYTNSDKSLTNLMPISILPLVAYLFNKIRMDIKINHLEEELINKKTK